MLHIFSNTLIFVLFLVYPSSSFHSTGISRIERQLFRSRNLFTSTQPEIISPVKTEDGDIYTQILNVAESAARKAGVLIRENIGARVKYSKTNYKDVVTEIDIASQKIIEETIRNAFPEHGFLGEESVDAGHCASINALELTLAGDGKEWLWCVDPIDGTTNFASGLPICVVSIGVAYNSEVTVGLIYNPILEEMYTSIKGRGAFCNGQPIRVAEGDIREAVVNCGYPVGNPVATKTSMRGFAALSSRARGLRVIACAAQAMAWIAQGKLSAYYSYDLNSWDVAAGALLVREAGGQVTDLDNQPYSLRTRDMLCSQGGSVHTDILKILGDADALHYMEVDSCELPDFLNVRKTRLKTENKPKTFWYDSRGQN